MIHIRDRSLRRTSRERMAIAHRQHQTAGTRKHAACELSAVGHACGRTTLRGRQGKSPAQVPVRVPMGHARQTMVTRCCEHLCTAGKSSRNSLWLDLCDRAISRVRKLRARAFHRRAPSGRPRGRARRARRTHASRARAARRPACGRALARSNRRALARESGAGTREPGSVVSIAPSEVRVTALGRMGRKRPPSSAAARPPGPNSMSASRSRAASP